MGAKGGIQNPKILFFFSGIDHDYLYCFLKVIERIKLAGDQYKVPGSKKLYAVTKKGDSICLKNRKQAIGKDFKPSLLLSQ